MFQSAKLNIPAIRAVKSKNKVDFTGYLLYNKSRAQ